MGRPDVGMGPRGGPAFDEMKSGFSLRIFWAGGRAPNRAFLGARAFLQPYGTRGGGVRFVDFSLPVGPPFFCSAGRGFASNFPGGGPGSGPESRVFGRPRFPASVWDPGGGGPFCGLFPPCCPPPFFFRRLGGSLRIFRGGGGGVGPRIAGFLGARAFPMPVFPGVSKADLLEDAENTTLCGA